MDSWGLFCVVDGVLVLGEPGRARFEFHPGQVVYYGEAQFDDHRWGWGDVESMVLSVPQGRSRLPLRISSVFHTVMAAAGESYSDLRPRDGKVIVQAAGETLVVPLSLYHFGKYWAGYVDCGQRLLNQLIGDPETRQLLAHPHELLATTAQAVTSR